MISPQVILKNPQETDASSQEETSEKEASCHDGMNTPFRSFSKV